MLEEQKKMLQKVRHLKYLNKKKEREWEKKRKKITDDEKCNTVSMTRCNEQACKNLWRSFMMQQTRACLNCGQHCHRWWFSRCSWTRPMIYKTLERGKKLFKRKKIMFLSKKMLFFLVFLIASLFFTWTLSRVSNNFVRNNVKCSMSSVFL